MPLLHKKTNPRSDVVDFESYRKLKKKDVQPESAQKQHNIRVFIPSHIEDLKDIIDYIRMGNVVVCNMRTLNIDELQRYTDFIHGGCYALGCKISNISDRVLMISS